MKYIFVSDIHGSVDGVKKIVEIYKKEQANKIIILGDTASSMNSDDNKKIAEILNDMKNNVEVIRGNCDTILFEDMLDFEMYDTDILYVNGQYITITHGHHYNAEKFSENCCNIFMQGHTHIPMLQKQNGIIFANPGSITRPRGTNLRCYILLDEEKIYLKTLDRIVIKGLTF